MREMAAFAEINFQSEFEASCNRNFSFLNSICSPTLWMTSKRIGNKPASCRFDSKSFCVSSSVNSGAARNVTTPTFALAVEDGSAGSALAGLTLNRELPHEAFKSSRDNQSASEAIDRYFVAPFMIFSYN